MKTEKHDDVMHAVYIYAIGTIAVSLLSVLLNLVFIACTNIAAENQVSAEITFSQR